MDANIQLDDLSKDTDELRDSLHPDDKNPNEPEVSRRFQLMLTQYEIVSNRFLTLFTGVQTLININLVISVGIIAAMVAIAGKYEDFYTMNTSMMLIAVLACVGLVGAVGCMHTLIICKGQLSDMMKQIRKIEDEHSIHTEGLTVYGAPLIITLISFLGFAAVFFTIAVISLSQYLKLKNFDAFWGISETLRHFLSFVAVVMLLVLYTIAYIGMKNRKQIVSSVTHSWN